MKRIRFSILIVILFLCSNYTNAQGPKYSPSDSEEIYGTWINEEYVKKNQAFPVKIKYTADGKFEWFYRSDESASPALKGTLEIIEKWTDSDGNIWYKTIWKDDWAGSTAYHLEKIGKSKMTYEYVKDYGSFPNLINQNNTTYHIYMRKN